MMIHPQFRLNGQDITPDILSDMAYSLIKEGEGDEMAMGEFLMDWLSSRRTITVKSSGSTGTPKTIKLQKSHMIKSATATGAFFGLNAGDNALLCLPVEYIAGKMMLVRAMVLGLHLDAVDPSSEPLRFTSKNYDFCAMVPMQLSNSIKQLSQVNKLIVGGAPLSKKIKSCLSKQSTKVYETYGMTETITHIAAKPIDQDSFEVLPNVGITKDNRGCLVIDAPEIGCNNLITNDLIDLLDNKHFKWLGRFDNIINSGGVKLMPEHIEAKLSQVIDVPFFVGGMPDVNLGEKLVLVVKGQVDEELLMDNIKALKSVAKYEVPKDIYKLPQFLMTDTNKIMRKKTLALINPSKN
ncbi:MAG: AMP-binding protein [Croceitalea sp.]|nr:AMP-binding protein [Croceitalea sp.]